MQPPQQERPPLTAQLSAQEFAAWYWLKEELVSFCQTTKISPTGRKRAIEARIFDFLAGRSTNAKPKRRLHPAPPVRHTGPMPDKFHLVTLIGPGWRCGPKLGAFLREHLGPGFRFNAPVRDFFHTGAGKRLGEVEAVYRESIRPDAPTRPIPEQLEYNRHFREYFQSHPNATREAAIAAWWAKRLQRR